MWTIIFRLYYAKFRYLEFPGSAVIQGFIPGTNITKKYVLEMIFSFQILFNKNLQKINPYYYKTQKYIYRYTRCWRCWYKELYTSFVNVSSSFLYFYMEFGM